MLGQISLLLFVALFSLFAAGFPSMPWVNGILFACTMVICLSGIIGGLLASLGVSLLILFLFGSVLIGGMLAGWPILLSVDGIVTWMAVFLIAAVITGSMHRLVTGAIADYEEMKGKFDGLVTIDEVTGFYNDSRFLFALEEEFGRSRRTGIPFSLLLIEVLYLDRFVQLYGRKETDHLLRSLAAILQENTRITDRKFRLATSKGTFAVILSSSAEEGAEVVMRKLESLLKVHTLENQKKQVTLTIAFGLKSYGDDVSDHTELVKCAQHELDHYIQ